MIVITHKTCVFLLILLTIYIIHKIISVIFPIICDKSIKEIEKNPKWIIEKIDYYGFHDIDIILAKSKLSTLPRFRISKNNRLEVLLPDNTSVESIEEIFKYALTGKIAIRYGLFCPDKPIYWLSTLCYMLEEENMRPEDKKPIDDNIKM